MPEGHSLRRLALAFDELFVGHTCYLSSPQGRFAIGAARLDGSRMVAAESVGKHLFLGFEMTAQTLWVHVHLGLYGSWRFSGVVSDNTRTSRGGVVSQVIGAPRTLDAAEDTALSAPTTDPDSAMRFVAAEAAWSAEGSWQAPEPRGEIRLRVLTDQSVADLSGPTRCEVVTTAEKEQIIAGLGPDPLGPTADQALDRAEFIRRVRSSGRAVGDLVMDQSVAAGVGNIYRAEGLFRAGISPFRAGKRVSEQRLGRLWDDFTAMLQAGVAEGSINTLLPADRTDEPQPGDPEAARWYVYHRAERPCLRCGRPVRSRDFKGRSLYWCPTCQR